MLLDCIQLISWREERWMADLSEKVLCSVPIKKEAKAVFYISSSQYYQKQDTSVVDETGLACIKANHQ